MIRVLVVDDHPAMQAGLTAVLRAEPGLVPVGAVETEFELWPALTRTRPDVVLLDYHLTSSNGLALCRQVKRTLPPPAVLLFSAYADALHIVVRDDGEGLPGEARPGSHGLPSMRNRAETIGAEIELEPGPDGRGTVVTLNVPLMHATEAAT